METINKLSILLRISENLDRCLNGNIKMVSCNIELDTVTITVDPIADPILEVSAALDCASSFKKTFNKKLIIL